MLNNEPTVSTPNTPHKKNYINRRVRNGSFAHAVKRVSLASKHKIWDTNDASIAATQTALSQWEKTYATLRSLVVNTTSSAKSAYSTAKSGAHSIEHHLLVPVRDIVLIPAFSTAEHVTSSAVGFISSDDAKQLVSASFQIVKQTPFVGETILAPAILTSTDILKNTWEILKYPIPPPKDVADITDSIMTVTKCTIVNIWTECYFYTKLLDANITRTLMHTQWRILGSGPYVTLDDVSKQELISHLCDRYMSYKNEVARYEFAKHIQIQNSNLYDDLVVKGVLYERGADFIKDDEWLLPSPSYTLTETPFFLRGREGQKDNSVKPMWFYEKNKIGNPSNSWISFHREDQILLEDGFIQWYDRMHTVHSNKRASPSRPGDSLLRSRDNGMSPINRSRIDLEEEQTTSSYKDDFLFSTFKQILDEKYHTIAQWYHPSKEDILVDQHRHAVTFISESSWREPSISPNLSQPTGINFPTTDQYHERSEVCFDSLVNSNILLPEIKMIKRPTMWRFHGTGETVRRGVWLLDTKRHGVQPYSDASVIILEDAYLFLKHRIKCNQKINADDQMENVEGILLTVQVSSPDDENEQQLVQFRSLEQITAVQKTLGAAVSIFKRRVYRGVCWEAPSSKQFYDKEQTKDIPQVEELGKNRVKDSPERHGLKEDSNTKTNDLVAAPYSIWKEIKTFSRSNADDANHLILVVHGIGEMLRNVDFFGLAQLSTIVECCDNLRKNHELVTNEEKEVKLLNLDDDPIPSFSKNKTNDRVEYLPVEWHEAFAIHSQRKHQNQEWKRHNGGSGVDFMHTMEELRSVGHDSRKPTPTTSPISVQDISLKTIPRLRSFANDTLLDVLYFMSPEHHDVLIDIVTHEMNTVVEKYRSLTGYNGKISLMAHSLGSIITWDILAHQEERFQRNNSMRKKPSFIHLYGGFEDNDIEDQKDSFLSRLSNSSTSNLDEYNSRLDNTVTEPMLKPNYPQLSFSVSNTFILGSPVAVFLLIRDQREPLALNYTLPGCKRIFNIFHPYDPAAYRIEPLIHPQNARIEAKLITNWKNGGFRMQYQTKMLWKKLVEKSFQTKQNVLEAVENGMSEMGLLDYSNMNIEAIAEEEEEDHEGNYNEDSYTYEVAQCGILNQGRRIDYMLQEKEIEKTNEYVFALGAHSTYWDEKDLTSFVAREILENNDEW